MLFNKKLFQTYRTSSVPKDVFWQEKYKQALKKRYPALRRSRGGVNKKISYVISAIAFVIALSIGPQATRAQSPGVEPTVTITEGMQPSMEKEEILVQITALHTQHTDLLSEAMRNYYSEAPEREASRQALVSNGQQISQLINVQFGSEAQELFDNYWNESVSQLLNYTDAIKQDNEQAQGAALTGLHRNIIQASQLIAEDTNIPQETIDLVLRNHINALRGVIESYDRGQYADSYAQQIIAQQQITVIAKTITDAWIQ